MMKMRGDPATLAEAVRKTLQREMPGQTYVTTEPMRDLVAAQHRSWRLGAIMFAAFGALALVVAAVGLYGVIAYNVAHNCANFLVQGQQLIALASDPFGVKWDLFGTANFRADIGLIDARVTWYVAIGAIVAGHVVAIWLAHVVALREFSTRRQAALATVPLTLLMVAYTVVSLSVIAEPMVVFIPPETAISR